MAEESKGGDAEALRIKFFQYCSNLLNPTALAGFCPLTRDIWALCWWGSDPFLTSYLSDAIIKRKRTRMVYRRKSIGHFFGCWQIVYRTGVIFSFAHRWKNWIIWMNLDRKHWWVPFSTFMAFEKWQAIFRTGIRRIIYLIILVNLLSSFCSLSCSAKLAEQSESFSCIISKKALATEFGSVVKECS